MIHKIGKMLKTTFYFSLKKRIKKDCAAGLKIVYFVCIEERANSIFAFSTESDV